MKKSLIVALYALLVMAVAVPASAEVLDWTFDLSGHGGSTFTGVDALNVIGSTDITQSFGDDGIFSNGDTFTASSYLGVVQVDNGPLHSVVISGGKELFFASSNLTGVVYDVEASADPNAPTSFFGADSFLYAYTGGNVTLYVGDHNNIGASTALTTFTVTSGISTPNSVDLGGNYLSGDLDFIMEFDGAADGAGIFLTDNLGDIEEAVMNLYTAYLVFDLGNNLAIRNLVPTFDDDENSTGFTASVTTSGNASLVVTPEPSTFLIFGLGLCGLIAFRRKMS